MNCLTMKLNKHFTLVPDEFRALGRVVRANVIKGTSKILELENSLVRWSIVYYTFGFITVLSLRGTEIIVATRSVRS